jgi:hypothetical protein
MSPWSALAAVLLWIASVAAAYSYGDSVGTDSEKVKQSEIKQAIEDTRGIARQGAANEIAKIKVRNTTIQSNLREVVRLSPAGVDCKLPADGLRLINEALTGESVRPGRNSDRGLPAIDTPH